MKGREIWGVKIVIVFVNSFQFSFSFFELCSRLFSELTWSFKIFKIKNSGSFLVFPWPQDISRNSIMQSTDNVGTAPIKCTDLIKWAWDFWNIRFFFQSSIPDFKSFLCGFAFAIWKKILFENIRISSSTWFAKISTFCCK